MIMVRCFCCLRDFPYSDHRYGGRPVDAYEIAVCDPCYNTNWDGWAPHMEKRLLEHLRALERPIPQRNKFEFLPREG